MHRNIKVIEEINTEKTLNEDISNNEVLVIMESWRFQPLNQRTIKITQFGRIINPF